MKRVAFVELPDEGLEVLSHYTQDPEWEAVLIVDPDPESYAVRMAQVLGIPVQSSPDPEKLMLTDLVVLGDTVAVQLTTYRELLSPGGTEVVLARDVARQLEIDLGPKESMAIPAPDTTDEEIDEAVSEIFEGAVEELLEDPASRQKVDPMDTGSAPESEEIEVPAQEGQAGNEAPEAEAEAPAPGEVDWRSEDKLYAKLDEIMSSDFPFPERLCKIGEILKTALAADYVHVFLKDPVSRRLDLASEPAGMSASVDRSLPMDRGIFGWVLQGGESRLMTVGDSVSGQEHAIACLTLNTGRPDALIVLENFAVATEERSAIETFLESLVAQIEDIYQLELGVETQDILSGFRMRIADRASQLEGLPDDQRIQPALDFANQVLASEVAYWIPERDAKPYIAQPQTQQGARIVADAWGTLHTLADYVRDHGSGMWSPSLTTSAPEAPVPYVGVRERNGHGVLLIMYSPDEKGGPSDQLPQNMLTEILLGVCDILRKDRNAARSLESKKSMSPDQSGMGVWTEKILTRAELEQRVYEEQLRSQRFGHTFSLVRFKYVEDAQVSDADLEFLAEFLFRKKRAVDFVGEIAAGEFIILSPNSDPAAEGLRARFRESWDRQHPPHYLAIERCYASPDAQGGFRFIGESEAAEEGAA